MKESKQPENLNQNNNNSITSNGNNNVANQTNINQLNYNTQVYHYWNNSARPTEPPFIEFWKEVRNVLIKALISSLLTLPWSGEMKNIFPMLKTVNPVWITVVLWLMLYGISSLYIMIYRYRGQRIVSAVFFLAAIFIGLVILENLLKNYAIILDMIVIICVSSLIIVDIVRMIKKGITANKCRIKKVKDGKKPETAIIRIINSNTFSGCWYRHLFIWPAGAGRIAETCTGPLPAYPQNGPLPMEAGHFRRSYQFIPGSPARL